MATVYMAPAASGGSDGNSGTIGSPKLTFGGAAAIMNAGDNCYLRGGNYLHSTFQGGFTGGTSWSAAKTFQNYPGETPILKPQEGIGANYFALTGTNCKYIIFSGETDGVGTQKMIFDGSDVTATNLLKITGTPNCSFIRFQGVIARNSAGGQGFLLSEGVTGCELIRCRFHNNGSNGGNLVHGGYWGGDTGIITQCEFDHNGSYGLQLYHDSGAASVFNNLVYGNLFHDNAQNNPATTGGGGELLVAAGDGNLLYNNVIYAGRNEGLAVYFRISTTNTGIYYNTIYGCTSNGLRVYAGCSGTTLKNNISYNNGTNYVDAGTGTVASNNSTSGTNPQFVNPAAGNFHLTASTPGSILNSGVAIGGITVDYDGNTRANPPEIGAFEYLVADPPPTVPPAVISLWHARRAVGLC